jgi:hypothetical protein
MNKSEIKGESNRPLYVAILAIAVIAFVFSYVVPNWGG